MTVSARYKAVTAELADVCRRAGREPSEVTLVAVSKTVGAEEVASAIQAGARDFGENRPDQLMAKADRFTAPSWHFIGNIQSRRIRDIVGRATLVHSLFQERHALKIDEVAAGRGVVQDVLVEVNVSGEQSKSGLASGEVAGMLDACRGLAHVRVCGLMTMAPQGDPEAAREVFAGLRRLHGEVRGGLDPEAAAAFTELSMGMSDDWREAVQEGATIIRVGRAIFSETF